MKELQVSFEKPEDLNCSLGESHGQIVAVKSPGSPQIPAGFILYCLNGRLICGQGLTLQDVDKMVAMQENYPLTLVFRSQDSQEESKVKKKLKLPVSDDFFGEIPPLTNEEISHYQTLAKSWVEGLLDASTSSEGFQFIGTKDNVNIYSGVRAGSRVHLIRGQTKIKLTNAELRALMITPTTESFRRLFHMIDVQFQDGYMLHQFPSGYQHPEVPFFSIKWAIMGAPGPVWGRDVCWLEYGDIMTDDNGKEVGFGVGASIDRPECPSLEHLKLIRAEMLCTGYVFRDSEEPGYIDVTYVIQADPKGWLPVWVINMFSWHQAMNVARIRNIAEGVSRAMERMSHHKRHGASIQGVLVPHGKQHSIDVTVTESNSVLSFGFCTASHDIGFNITGLPEKQEWTMMKRYDAEEKPISGEVTVGVGEYCLLFDNTYSWFKSKQVYYWYCVSGDSAS